MQLPKQLVIILIMHYNDLKQSFLSRQPLSAKSNNITAPKLFTASKKPAPASKKPSATVQNKENQQCTFQPRINDESRNRRSLERFIRDQEQYQVSKEMKIQQLRQEINRSEDQENTGRPSIDGRSKMIANSQNSSLKQTNIFERLSKEKEIIYCAPQESLFSPKILDRSKSMVRKLNVSTLLYEDAKRRQEKQITVIESERKQIDLLTSPKINNNTNALVLRRFATQFNELATDDQMNPLIALSILEELFNVDLNPNRNQATNLLVQHVLSFLTESDKIVQKEKLWHFISIIINGHVSNSLFSESEQTQIFEKFQHFYKERMTRERKIVSPQPHSFRPKTLASSSKLANSFREKTCQQIENFIQKQKINTTVKDGNYTIQDLFVLQHLKKQAENQKRKIEQQNKQLEECTFKPDLTNSASSLHLIKKKPKVTLKVNNRSKIIKTQYTHSDIETQLNVSNISHIGASKNKEDGIRRRNQRIATLSNNIRDVQKVIMRMSAGRQKREFSKTVLERGYPQGQNWNEYQRDMHRQSVQNSQKLKGLGFK